MIKAIKLFKMSMRGNDHMVIATPEKYNPKSQRILVSVNNKVAEAIYNPKTGNVTAKLDAPSTNANHPMAVLLPQNPDVRVKVFVYDFIKDRILGAKLQEFELNLQTFDYHATDELLTTSPVIMGAYDLKAMAKRAKKGEGVEKPTQVKIVEIVTVLEKGSANDGLGKNLQNGMVYGKNYSFRVIAFTQEKPKDLKKIEWYMKYHNLTLNKWEEIALKNTGDEITIYMNNLEMCGRYVYVRAYLNDIKIFGETKVWMHNRFRWFDRQVVRNEVEARFSNPQLANQKTTPLCGMAAIIYLLAKRNFNLYQDFILDLHRKGYFKINNYEVDITRSLHLLEVDPITNKKYPKNKDGIMPYCDWISFSSIRNQENEVREYNGLDDPEFDGATLPNEIVKLMKQLLNFKNVTDYTNFFTTKGYLIWDGKFSATRELAVMQDLYKSGFEVVMLINANMLYNKVSGVTDLPEHLVVFEGLKDDTLSFELFKFKVFSYGEIFNLSLSPTMFTTNFYGYIYGK